MRFSVLIESFCGFAIVDNFFDGLEVLIDPLILPYSGVPHGFLFCKLKISLSKITDHHFRSVLCVKLQ